MSFDQALKKVKTGSIERIHVLYGSQRFLMDEYIQELSKQVLDEETADFNFERYELSENPIEQAIEAAETLPFMGERRLIIANDATFLTGQKSTSKVEHDLSALERYVQDPVDYSVFVLLIHQDKLDERKKVVKELKKSGRLISCQALKENELVPWLIERAQMYQVVMTDEGAALLVQLVGGQLQMLQKELEKVAQYVGKGGKITPDEIRELVTKTVEQDVFSLIEHVVHSRLQPAFQTLQELLKRNEEPIKILFLLARQFRIIFRVKEMERKGYTQSQMAQTIGIHPYVAKLAVQQSKRFTSEQLLLILDQLAEADYEMKIGKKDKPLVLEMFFIQLSQYK
ncbi:DNA polymerase III subunit delta [Bacillus horti]|nr:DNA polymerase III subunit delta [Bacillus horti]